MRKGMMYAVPALEKGLDILEALSAAPGPQALVDLAAALGRSSSELYRMLACLQRRGYIRRDDLGGYSLTLKLYELAHAHSPVDRLIRAAAGPMRALAQEIRRSCHLSVLDGASVVVIYQVTSPEPARLAFEVGGRFSAVHTASGRLLLANLPEPARASVLREDPEHAGWSRNRRNAFARRLDSIARAGVSEAENETIIGIHDAAFLIGKPGSPRIAALCATSLVPRGAGGTLKKCHARIGRCAREITGAIGLGG